jgi:ribosomal protein S18 acetylase RimI-like enzyme
MSVQISLVSSKRDLRQFIYLPEKIHRDHEGWVHPLYADEFSFFSRSRNPAFHNCDTVLALAHNNRQVSGRIMGIINHAANERNGQFHARFCFLEAYPDGETACALLGFIENWAVGKGMHKLVGPLGFSDKDPQGMMVEGFGQLPVIATNMNFAWMNKLLAAHGYRKEIDLVSYLVHVPDNIPAYLLKSCERIERNCHLKLMEFSRKKELKPWIIPIFRLINETYQPIYGFMPLSESEMKELARRYLPVLNPAFIKVVADNDNSPVAFLIAMPELSQGIRRAHGRIWPFGWIHILREARRSKLLTMLLGAIHPEQRGKGIDALMAVRLLQSAQKAGLTLIDSHLVMETNTRMRAEYERIGGTIHKRFRIYAKTLRTTDCPEGF